MNPIESDSRENNQLVYSTGRKDGNRVPLLRDLSLLDLAAILFHVRLLIDKLMEEQAKINSNLYESSTYTFFKACHNKC